MAARSIAFVVVVYFLLAAAPVEARTGVLNHDGHARSVELSMCDTQQPDDTLLSIHSELSAQGKLRKVKPRDARAYTVNTYFHFVVTADTAALYPPEKRDQLATAQLQALNTAYAPANITFSPSAPPTFTVNTTWATNQDDLAMKTALRAGAYSSLNIYFQSNLSPPGEYDPNSFLLGYCLLPTSASRISCLSSAGHNASNTNGCTSTSYAPTDFVKDGCNVLAATMPGGPLQMYNEGKTAVHEIGHWFGLLHTFEGGDDANGWVSEGEG
ncbi:MAG: hypothetical protein L6R41_001080 [Letrouitia leprolyta]|nr:MAG: hypothetical protein L6R41_001080 [Letrouitia leprolyta]